MAALDRLQQLAHVHVDEYDRCVTGTNSRICVTLGRSVHFAQPHAHVARHVNITTLLHILSIHDHMIRNMGFVSQ